MSKERSVGWVIKRKDSDLFYSGDAIYSPEFRFSLSITNARIITDKKELNKFHASPKKAEYECYAVVLVKSEEEKKAPVKKTEKRVVMKLVPKKASPKVAAKPARTSKAVPKKAAKPVAKKAPAKKAAPVKKVVKKATAKKKTK